MHGKTATKLEDQWSSEAYQHSASFVPKLASKILCWLDPQKDDVILDIGCGDAVLDIQIAQILAQGKGRLHGIDSSKAMIAAARKKAEEDDAASGRCTFEVLDATELASTASLLGHGRIQFTKAFSNAAMHWILRPEAKREAFFAGVRDVVLGAPGSTFAFEMGGLGNVAEIRAALYTALSRRVGIERAREADPWFFPDEQWIRHMMEEQVGGWTVDKLEREWRPTPADAGGVEGWLRLMAASFFQLLEDEGEREECIREVKDVLEVICCAPDGSIVYNYVRLRVLARKL